MLKLGLDVGSTTVKVVLLDGDSQADSEPVLLFEDYQRHHADIHQSITRVLEDLAAAWAVKFGAESVQNTYIEAAITGSAGLGIAEALGVDSIDFVQEVIAETEAVQCYKPETDVIIELGGEDAKITYLKPTPEQRMNGTCAGGTGAFIDQMASLLKTDATGLNALAGKYNKLYPIASRCGVFAKTDLQPLINDGAPSEDLAASIFQAVATQTIAGLACGRIIKGNIIFLGGPLYFLPELRNAFKRALNKTVDNFETPQSAQLFVAIGAALTANNPKYVKRVKVTNSLPKLNELIEKLKSVAKSSKNTSTKRLSPLFATKQDLQAFEARHNNSSITQLPIENATGAVFLGIDAGSTTIKATLINSESQICYSYYGNNEGDPVAKAVEIVKDIRLNLPNSAIIARSYVTGYGEELIKAALHIDGGEVETVAHFRAAKQIDPNVTSIIDIGGQDMKFLSIKDNVIDNIAVNEACSSGCGSFLQAFASTMNKTVPQFADAACNGSNPVDLGSRCTVFMNSSVKQAQKEGADINDIAAGLSYSVVRNALYKVIKLRDVKQLGSNVVVQGGTFLNNAVLRAFELLTGLEVTRPNISGLMGAYGAALIAKDTYLPGAPSKVLTLLQLENLTLLTDVITCPFCPNKCNLTVTKFSDGGEYVSGNRCENGTDAPMFYRQKSINENQDKTEQITANTLENLALSNTKKAKSVDNLNLFDYKYERTFSNKYYPAFTKETAKKENREYLGVIGVPRALNMYENYPFWHTVLSKLGFEVKLSGRSNHKIFEKGMDSIASENICYPAKLVHGHIMDLIERKIDRIFYPCVTYEQKYDINSDNCYNCPVVANYPQVIANNIDQLRGNRREAKYKKHSEDYNRQKHPEIDFIYPYFSLDKPEGVQKRVYDEFKHFGVTQIDAKNAVNAAYKAIFEYKQDITNYGQKIMKNAQELNIPVIILAGRPYHTDVEVNHGIPEAIRLLNAAVISEDCGSEIFDLGVQSGIYEELKRPLRVTDQWSYHSRVYKSAALAAQNENVELVQLNSFGCGLDAVVTDQCNEIIKAYGGIYTVLKIDEVSNLGAIKIRLRSLLAARSRRSKELIAQDAKNFIPTNVIEENSFYGKDRVKFTKAMKRDYKILIPQMSPVHFDLIESIFKREKYNIELLKIASNEDIECGLKYVNNDACYPAIIVIGQLINTIINGVKSGKYDINKVAVIISQTGGMCRATNYIGMLRLGLQSAGFGNIPVISISTQGLEKNPGFKLGKKELLWTIRLLLLGDLISHCLLRVRPYEAVRGSANDLQNKWISRIKAWVEKNPDEKLNGDDFNIISLTYKKAVRMIVNDFTKLDLRDMSRKPKVGIVGEILVKYHPDANNHVINVIEDEGCEAVLPGIINFMTNKLFIDKWNFHNISRGSTKSMLAKKVARWFIGLYITPVNNALKNSNGRFDLWADMREIVYYASTVTSPGVQAGEGWLLAGEIVELIKTGSPNIVVANPFACLPNHVTGRGIFAEIRRQHPEANIVSIDYDPGASQVNQLNRIKLMISAIKK